jgi:molybdopterin molybdotransferase
MMKQDDDKNEEGEEEARRDDHPMIPVPEAIRMVLRETARHQLVQQVVEAGGGLQVRTDSLPVDHHLVGRVMAHDIYMPEPGYPPFAASILDGYAVRRQDFDTGAGGDPPTLPVELTILGRVHAGDDNDVPQDSTKSILLEDRKVALYVTTGAKIPDTGGFDCVVAIEDTVVSSDRRKVTIPALLPNKAWIRLPGSDIPAQTLLLQAGDMVTPVDVGLLLQAAYTNVLVRKRVRVGIVSTGNELVVGLAIAATTGDDDDDQRKNNWLTERNGQIPDVNGPLLLGLLGSMMPKVDALGFGVVRDDSVDALAEALRAAASQCDVLITTGGISVGDADLIEQVMVHHLGGILHFGRLHMKPGKPSTFLTLPNNNHTLVFCLPGNPVSAYVCAQLLVQPCLDLLCRGSSSSSISLPDIEVVVENALVVSEELMALPHDIMLDWERPEYHRVIQKNGPKTTYQSTGVQQSSRLLSCQRCAGLVVLPQATREKPVAKQGETYMFLKIHDTARIRVGDSLHMMQMQQPKRNDHGLDEKDRLRVTLLQFGPLDTSLADIIELRDLRPATTATTTTSDRPDQKRVFKLLEHRSIASIDHFLIDDDWSVTQQDLTIIVGPSESLRAYSLVASRVRSMLTKCADAMALRVMQYCAAADDDDNNTAAAAAASPLVLRDCIIGSIGGENNNNNNNNNNSSSLLIYISSAGLQHGLPQLRDVLIQAIRVAKGNWNEEEEH